MTKRDYLIIFCLLLPFFITLPWAITTHSKLQEQRELTELVRDTLHIVRLRHNRLLEATEAGPKPQPQQEDNTAAPLPAAPEEEVESLTTSVPAVETVRETAALANTTEALALKNAPPPVVTETTPKEVESTVPAPAVSPPVESKKETLQATASPVKQRASDPPPAPNPPTPAKSAPLRLVPDAVSTAPVNARLQQQLGLSSEAALRTGELNVRVLQEVRGDAPSSPDNDRRLRVDFALSKVPEAYQGQKSSLYLVVTDRSGDPLPGIRPISATVPVNGTKIQLTAMTKKDITLKASQSLRLEQKITKQLPSGNYRVQVFSDMALLGVTELIVPN